MRERLAGGLAALVSSLAVTLLFPGLAAATHVSPVTPTFGSYLDPPNVSDDPTEVVSGDFDGDGNDDVATNSTASELSVLYGSGTGILPEPSSQVALPGAALVLAAGDFNSDGFDDVAAFGDSGATDTLTVRRGSAAGLTATGSSVSFTGATPTGIATGMLDSDGDLDLAVTSSASGNERLTPLLNDGGATFTAGAAVTSPCLGSGLPAFDVVLADADGDQKTDALLSCALEFDVLPGDGSGAFGSPTAFSPVTTVDRIDATDFDGDGDPDVVLGDFDGGTNALVMLSLNDGSGAYSAPSTTFFKLNAATAGSNVRVRAIAAGDVNGDTHPDVVVSYGDASGATTPSEVVVLLGDGLSSFTPVDTAPSPDEYGIPTDLNTLSYGSSLGALGITLADLNGDGRPDPVATAPGHSTGLDRVVPLLSTATPAAQTGPATAVNQTQAQLEGTVRPGALATSYQFEYGTTTAYGTVTTLGGVPSGGSQSVAAQVTALQPSTTYHYRLRADNANGEWIGLDRTFTTASPPAGPPSSPQSIPGNQGRPSVSGKVKQGRRLTCSPGSWSGNPTFDFAWLRNGDPIAGQTGSSYRVAKKDVGRALQCQVSAINGAGSATAESKPAVASAKKKR